MIVILDNLRSAHNVGSILRTCDAMGVKEVYLCGITPSADHPKVQKTSLGAESNIDIHTSESTEKVIKDLSKSHIIVGLELHKDSVPVDTLRTDKDIALVVGNEVSGLSEDLIEKCDMLVFIPMNGIKESLNVSVAFGIAAFELTKGCK